MGTPQKAHPILAFAEIDDIVVGADPGHEITPGGALVGCVAEAEHQASVRRVPTHVPIAGEGGR